MKTRAQPAQTNPSTAAVVQQTLLDHLHELRARLFWVVLALIAASSLGWTIQDQIMNVLMSPLGGQRLVYLTPIGGFNFLFKVALYFGIGLVLPVIVYHLYRFLEPLMNKRHKRSVVFYSFMSTLLAVSGASFAYFASLPAALHFLTGLNIQNVSAMLTVDSYLSFVVVYLLGFAVLFQIPLILMIINTIKPLKPKKLMSFERYVILAAFVIAAMISPTPDVTNQTILAIPIILMYQVGVLLVWLQNRRAKKHSAKRQAAAEPLFTIKQPQTTRPLYAAPLPVAKPIAAPAVRRVRPVMDISAGRGVGGGARAPRPITRAQIPPRSAARRPIDGVIASRQQIPQTN